MMNWAPLLFRVFGLSNPNRGSRRADSNRFTAPATSELFLLEEQPAPQFLGLRLIYWTVTKVQAGTMCVHVLSNTSGHKIPVRT